MSVTDVVSVDHIVIGISNQGNNGINIVWEWHLWDHLCQDVSSIYPNFVNVSEHPELFDINNGGVGSTGGPGGANADWMHINAVNYNPYLDQIVISSRTQNEIYVIDDLSTGSMKNIEHIENHPKFHCMIESVLCRSEA